MKTSFSLLPLLLCMPADGEAPAGDAPAVPNERGDLKAAAASIKAADVAAAADSPGVQSSLAAIDFLVALVQAVELAEADGKITITDLIDLKDVVPTVKPFLDGLHSIPDELKDLSADEVEQLIAEAAKAFPGAQNAQVVLKVKACLAFAKAGYDVFVAFKK